jgi:hypothetical protein
VFYGDAMIKLFWITIAIVPLVISGAAQAKVSARLAKQCRAMTWAAHPANLPDIPAVRNLRKDYYKVCVARRGKMDPLINR